MVNHKELARADHGVQDGGRRTGGSTPDHAPVVAAGLILYSEKSDTVVRYAVGGINAQVFASKYLTSFPTEEELRAEIERPKYAIASHRRP